MKLKIIYITAIIIVSASTVVGQTESKKADTSLVKSKAQNLSVVNKEGAPSDSNLQSETKSSGVVKPEPVIILRDEEKIIVQPKK